MWLGAWSALSEFERKSVWDAPSAGRKAYGWRRLDEPADSAPQPDFLSNSGGQSTS